jgi:hypothetical protein
LLPETPERQSPSREKDMLTKKQVLERLKAIARQLGWAPSVVEFEARSGISHYRVMQHFPTWSAAVKAAGLKPSRLRRIPKDGELLKNWGETVRRTGGVPTRHRYQLRGRYDPRTMEKRFGSWRGVAKAFGKFAKRKKEWRDVLAILEGEGESAEQWTQVEKSVARREGECARSRRLRGRRTYGNPMNFSGLRHEPVNELGVVLLFGMMAKKLGYLVESVQTGFPDCEAMREVAPGRWQRVKIEFEHMSRNFRRHGHAAAGCDVIVCWRHNWQECPKGLEVVELSKVVGG